MYGTSQAAGKRLHANNNERNKIAAAEADYSVVVEVDRSILGSVSRGQYYSAVAVLFPLCLHQDCHLYA